MNVRSLVLAAALAACGQGVAAQRPAPLPPPPVSLTVPRPIPPPQPQRDLYLQPQLPPPMPPPPPERAWVQLWPGYYVPQSVMPSVQAVPTEIPVGWLRFEATPEAGQVFVDGAYAGVISDYGTSGRALDLQAGRHRIDVRATGYVTQSFDVEIRPNEITRFRGDLERASAPPQPIAAAAAPAAVRNIYVIPNCYAGNRPPIRPLPAGCSLSAMIKR